MNVVDHKPQPESWDEATDLRRFWWLIFPLGVSAWVAGFLIFLDGGGSSLPLFGEPEKRTERFEQTLPAVDGQEVRLENIRGKVTIRTGAAGEVKLLVERTGTGRSEASAERSLAGIRTNVQADGEVIRVFMAGVSGQPRTADTKVTIFVPPGARIDAQTLAGDIAIEVESQVVIAAGTASGNIDVRIPQDATLTSWVEAKELRAQFQLERSNEIGGRVLFRNQVVDGYAVELDLRAPLGRITLRAW